MNRYLYTTSEYSEICLEKYYKYLTTGRFSILEFGKEASGFLASRLLQGEAQEHFDAVINDLLDVLFV